jgi:hypothetical protein
MKHELDDNERLTIIGFIISRTIDVERAIVYFLSLYYSNGKKELQEEFYEVLAEFTFNKKISLFHKIITKNSDTFKLSQKTKDLLAETRLIRNHAAHDSFSYSEEDEKYNFVNGSGKLSQIEKGMIDSYAITCRYIEKDIMHLCSRISFKHKK